MPPDFGEADREIRQLGDFKGELCSALMHEQFAAFILAGIKFRELDQSCTPLPLTFDITGAAQLHRAASVLMDGLGRIDGWLLVIVKPYDEFLVELLH